MNSYKAVQATFIPMNGMPVISPASVTRLPDGRIQFNLTAGAGVANQATIWAATSLARIEPLNLSGAIRIFTVLPRPGAAVSPAWR